MKYFLSLALSALCLAGYANGLNDNILTLEEKVLWAHSEGEKYQQKADLAETSEEVEVNLDKALRFFALEREYNTELGLYKLVADLEGCFCNDACDDEGHCPADWQSNIKSALSHLVA